MGVIFSQLYNALVDSFNDTPSRLVMLGLDAAGKTTILYKLKFNENINTIPTIGFNVETVQPCKGLTVTIWDVVGQDKIRKLWKHYYQNTDGLVYIIDSQDTSRFEESRHELVEILACDEMRGIPFIVLANKQDLPGAQSVSDIAKVLRLNEFSNAWHIQACCATTGYGLVEGFQRLGDLIRERRRNNQR